MFRRLFKRWHCSTDFPPSRLFSSHLMEIFLLLKMWDFPLQEKSLKATKKKISKMVWHSSHILKKNFFLKLNACTVVQLHISVSFSIDWLTTVHYLWIVVASLWTFAHAYQLTESVIFALCAANARWNYWWRRPRAIVKEFGEKILSVNRVNWGNGK